MIKYKILNFSFFKSVFNTISKIIDEGILTLSKTIKVYGKDPSGIMYFQLIIGESVVQTDSPETKKVTINIFDFQKIIKRIPNTADFISFGYNEVQSSIILQYKLNDKTRTYKLRLIDIDFSEFPIETLLDLDFSIILTMEASELYSIIKDCIIYSEFFHIKASPPTSIAIYTEGVIGGFTLNLDTEITEKIKISYGIVYLENILKEMKGEIDILLGQQSYGNGLPFFINYRHGEDSSLKIFIAPRLPDEEINND